MSASKQIEFRVGVRRRGGALLHAATGSASPCVEHARWRAALLGRTADGDFAPPDLAPVWAASGSPAVAGVKVALPGQEALVYDAAVFDATAYVTIRDLAKRGVLRGEDVVEWDVEASEIAVAPPRFRARVTRAGYPFVAAILDHVAREHLAVAVPREVLRQIRAQVVANPAVECAGVLVGRLLHDAARGAAELAIDTQVPLAAGEGGTSATHFAFGANSFAAARRAIADAGGGAITAGWWHSHPACAECPRNPTCEAHTVFFSGADVQVQAAAFPAPYAIALVAGKVRDQPATAPGVALYAWRAGIMEAFDLVANDAETVWRAEVPVAGRLATESGAPAAPRARPRALRVDAVIDKETPLDELPIEGAPHAAVSAVTDGETGADADRHASNAAAAPRHGRS